MIIVKLKEAMLAYQRRTGEKITYQDLARMTGIAPGTLQSIGSRENYHPTWENVEILCLTLDVPLHDMLEMIPNAPKPITKQRSKRILKKKSV